MLAEIYVHIPFCVKKCEYCDFLSAPGDEEKKEAYVQALCMEIHKSQWAKKAGRETVLVPSVFIGGGTPSTLKNEQLKRILNAIRENYTLTSDCEITMEMNPGTVSVGDLEEYRKIGINRISIGLQSTQDEELKKLGRIHTYKDFLGTYYSAVEAGFTNINVDLMAALPGQTIESYEESLQNVLALNPQPNHISAYSLIIEEGTPFFEKYREDDLRRQQGGQPKELPSEEEERKMDHRTEEILKAAGYHRYEISNYAKDGCECKHNVGYWIRSNYMGFGLGASGMMDNIRYKNTTDLDGYIKTIEKAELLSRECFEQEFQKTCVMEEITHLTREEQMEEFMFLGLRLSKGISATDFRSAFMTSIHDVYDNVLRELMEEGLLEESGEEEEEQYFLTSRGRDVSNYCLAKFLF